MRFALLCTKGEPCTELLSLLGTHTPPVLASILLFSMSAEALQDCVSIESSPGKMLKLPHRDSLKETGTSGSNRLFKLTTTQIPTELGHSTFTVEVGTTTGTLGIVSNDLVGQPFFFLTFNETIQTPRLKRGAYDYYWLNRNESCTFQYSSDLIFESASVGNAA